MFGLYGILCALALVTTVYMSSVALKEATGLHDASVYRAETVDLSHQLGVCETKHRALLGSIRKEGLWKRLGMEGQPWLR